MRGHSKHVERSVPSLAVPYLGFIAHPEAREEQAAGLGAAGPAHAPRLRTRPALVSRYSFVSACTERVRSMGKARRPVACCARGTQGGRGGSTHQAPTPCMHQHPRLHLQAAELLLCGGKRSVAACPGGTGRLQLLLQHVQRLRSGGHAGGAGLRLEAGGSVGAAMVLREGRQAQACASAQRPLVPRMLDGRAAQQ